MIDKSAKIYIAGHRGMVGSAIYRKFKKEGYSNFVFRTSSELDLRNQADVRIFFEKEKPDVVILAAARVGGIMANIEKPATFLYDNLAIQNNVINSAYENGVKKLLFLGSSCIYPRLAPQPMVEKCLLDGKVEPTNEGYAIAKIAGLKLCEYYNKQYGTDYISVMPCNLYGIEDNFDPLRSHVVAATIRKVHEAKMRGDKEIVVWGTGNARRELMFVDDAADACFFLINSYSGNEWFNVGIGKDYSITELTEVVMKVVGYEGKLVYDTTKPDGMPQKLLNVDKLSKAGWNYATDLERGIELTYQWYLNNFDRFN